VHVLLAPDAFKGSLSAQEVAEIWTRALAMVFPEATAILRPMADGGEGTLDVLCPHARNQRVHSVLDPTGEPILARWGLLSDKPLTAVIEVAEVVGYALSLNIRNPYTLGTSGVGILLRHILDQGIRRILIGLGGTTTVDGGLGMLTALGGKFWDATGCELPPVAASLSRIEHVDLSGLDPRLQESELIALADVTAPLLGSEGATVVYGPQKGVPPEDLEALDQYMERYALLLLRNLLEQNAKSSLFLRNPQELLAYPGTGAAGGLGFAFALLGAQLVPGAETIAKYIDLPRAIADADFVVTGEGQSDPQTLQGKVPLVVSRLAAARGKPTFLLSGSLGEGANALLPYFACLQTAVARPATLAEILPRAAEDLYEAAIRLFHCIAWRKKPLLYREK